MANKAESSVNTEKKQGGDTRFKPGQSQATHPGSQREPDIESHF